MSHKGCTPFGAASIFLTIFLLSSEPLLARTIKVPLHEKKISLAIGKASRGDTVLVAAGRYEEKVALKKGVVLLGGASPTYAERDPSRFETIIQCTGNGSAVRTTGDEDKATVLDGFTLTGGRGTFDKELGVYVGGGLYVTSSPTIRNSTIVSNGGDSTWGGGVFLGGGGADFVRNTVKGNLAEIGGGILCYGENSAPLIRDNVIIGNGSPKTRPEGAGGGICVLDGSHPAVEDNKISENGGDCRYGGGIWISGASPIVSKNLISLNKAEGGYGGGIGCQWSGCLISKNIFEKNSSGVGGGIWCSQANPEIRKNTFIRNSARGFVGSQGEEPVTTPRLGRVELIIGKGGGISCQDYANPRIEENLFEYNSAAAGGAVSVFSYSYPVVRGNTLVKNRSDSGLGAGIHFDDSSSPIVDRNIITHSTYGFGIYYEGSGSRASISCNDVWGNAQGSYKMWQTVKGDISEDPLFCDEFESNYYLDDTSPCVDLSGCGRIGAYPIGCTEAVRDTVFITFAKQRRFRALQFYDVSVDSVRKAIVDVLSETGEEITKIDRTVGIVDSITGQTDPGSFLVVTKERKLEPSRIQEFCTSAVVGSGPWRGLTWTINILLKTIPVVTVEVGAVMKVTESRWGGELLTCYSTGRLERDIAERIRKRIYRTGS